MNIRFVTRNVHAYLDYPVAVALMVLPFTLSLGQSNELAFWLSVVTGVAALLLTVFTDHKLGLIRVLPYELHLAVDFVVGVTFVAAPFVLGFSGLDAVYYWVNGGAVLTVVSLHSAEPSEVATA